MSEPALSPPSTATDPWQRGAWFGANLARRGGIQFHACSIAPHAPGGTPVREARPDPTAAHRQPDNQGYNPGR